MNLNQTIRWKAFYRHAFLAGLALLVFSWGLQYKISLDETPHSVTRHMVEAKLLSGDDMGAAAKGIAASLPANPETFLPAAPLSLIFFSFVAISLWGAFVPPPRRDFVAAHLWRRPRRITHGAFFFRPPPSL